MNRPQQPTTYGRQSQILRESIGGLPELTLAVNNYRNYLNRLLARLKDPKTVQVDQKVVAKMVRETTRHLGMVLSVARDNPNSIGFAHYLEIVKAYLIIQVQFLGKQVNVDQLMPEDNGTNDFLRLLSQFSLSDEQRHMLGEFITNLETQKTSLEALIKPLYPKFQQMIAASRQEITDVIRHPKKESGDSAIFGATTERIHEPTKKVEKPQKVSSRVAPVTQQFTELNVPGTSEDQEADELKIEF